MHAFMVINIGHGERIVRFRSQIDIIVYLEGLKFTVEQGFQCQQNSTPFIDANTDSLHL